MALTSLLVGGEERLEAFRKRRVHDPELELAHLRRVREILLFLFESLQRDEPTRWQRIERAFAVMVGQPVEETAAAPVSPPPPVSLSLPRTAATEVGAAASVPHASEAAPRPSSEHSGGPAAPKPTSPWLAAPPSPSRPRAGPSDTTAEVAALVVDDPMPFEPNVASAPPPLAAELGAHRAAGSTLIVEGDVLGETLPFDDGAERPLEPSLASLTVEQYAALTAARRAEPERRAEIEARYGVVSELERRALDAHWQRVLRTAPELAERFHTALVRYQTWLRSRT